MSQSKTIRYYNKNINNSIKLVRTCSGTENSFFHSILTSTVSNYVTFLENKKNKLVEKYIDSLKKAFKDELKAFYDYILKKEDKPSFADKIIKKSSYTELYHIICSLVKIEKLGSDMNSKAILKNGKEIIYKTNLPEDDKKYFYKKFQDMITTISNSVQTNITINEKLVSTISKNLNRNVYCIDYYNDERFVFSSENNYPKTIFLLKIKNNYEAIGLVKENNIIKRDLQSTDKDVKKILKILNNKDSTTLSDTASSSKEEKFEKEEDENEEHDNEDENEEQDNEDENEDHQKILPSFVKPSFE